MKRSVRLDANVSGSGAPSSTLSFAVTVPSVVWEKPTAKSCHCPAKAGARAESGEALHATKTAKTVRVRNGQVLTSDGPFAETKEQLGGFYILECETMEEAIELAAQIPGALNGCVEVRPCVNFG